MWGEGWLFPPDEEEEEEEEEEESDIVTVELRRQCCCVVVKARSRLLEGAHAGGGIVEAADVEGSEVPVRPRIGR